MTIKFLGDWLCARHYSKDSSSVLNLVVRTLWGRCLYHLWLYGRGELRLSIQGPALGGGCHPDSLTPEPFIMNTDMLWLLTCVWLNSTPDTRNRMPGRLHTCANTSQNKWDVDNAKHSDVKSSAPPNRRPLTTPGTFPNPEQKEVEAGLKRSAMPAEPIYLFISISGLVGSLILYIKGITPCTSWSMSRGLNDLIRGADAKHVSPTWTFHPRGTTANEAAVWKALKVACWAQERRRL